MSETDEVAVSPLASALKGIGGMVGQKSQKPRGQTSKEDSDQEPNERPDREGEETPESEEQSEDVPRGEDAESDDDDGTPIPIHRFNKVNERLKATKAELEEAKKELADLKAGDGAGAKTPSRKKAADTEGGDDDVLRPFARVAAAKELFSAAGHVLDTKQAEAALAILESHGLEPDYAVLVAQQKHPSLFGKGGKSKPPSHHVQDPGRGGQPSQPRDDRGRFMEKWNSPLTPTDRRELLVGRLGLLTGRK